MNTKKILNEFVQDKTTINDEIAYLSRDQRAELKKGLLTALNNTTEETESVEDLSEISYGGIPELKADGLFSGLKKWFKRFLTDKASSFLVDASASEMEDTIKLIDALDPYDLNGIFTPRAIYLGGGIDFAEDATSWRSKVEDFFGSDHVVKDDRLLRLVTTGQMDFKGLETPAILNPMRAETVREDDLEFQDLFKQWKSNELSNENFEQFREKIREQIVVQDLYMLKVCDTNLICFDGTAGAGTFGEAQFSALKNSQVFIWLTNGMKLSNVSPWMMPSITKVLVGDELWPFLQNFK
jgi:hypothetical protein|tara:strand:+ start:568 stop:1458 length:891 start_codon:yes stop_codon:yes gene_type:complete